MTSLATLVAAATARDAEPVAAPVLTEPHVGLRTGSRWFAVPAAAVAEVVPLPELTRLPAAPIHLPGVAMVRTRLTAFIDLDVLTVGRRTPRLERTRAVVIRGDGVELGVIAAETRGLLAIEVAGLLEDQAPPERPIWVAREARVGSELYAVIEPERLVAAALPGAA